MEEGGYVLRFTFYAFRFLSPPTPIRSQRAHGTGPDEVSLLVKRHFLPTRVCILLVISPPDGRGRGRYRNSSGESLFAQSARSTEQHNLFQKGCRNLHSQD